MNVVDRTDALPQLRSWGFNTVGAWSDPALEHSGAPFTVELHLGTSQGFPWNDFFNAQFSARVTAAAKSAAEPFHGNGQLIGYFSDNEIGWWGPSIFRFQLNGPKSSETRARLFALLRSHYRDDFARLQRDWRTPATDWESLESADKPQLWLRPNAHGMDAIQEFIAVAADRYYSVTSEALRRADPGRLLLGDRYPGYFETPVAAAAGRHLNVVSTNYGADFLDGSISHFYLDSLHRIAGKPLMVTEYYFAARENNTGNRNPGDVFPVVATQRERAQAFRRNLEELAAIPYNLGAHWFQYRDEPKGGRSGDGEDYDMGLVDIAGAPYLELTGAASRVDVRKIHRSGKPALPERNPDGPAIDPWAGMETWPREKTYVNPANPRTPADLYVMPTKSGVWLGFLYMDFMDAKLYQTQLDADADAARLTIRLRSGDELTVSMLPDGSTSVLGRGVEARSIRHGTRVFLIVKLPLTRSFSCSLRSAAGGWRGSWTWRRAAL